MNPDVIFHLIVSAIEAIILALIGFGLNWTGVQVGLVMAAVIALTNLVLYFVFRKRKRG